MGAGAVGAGLDRALASGLGVGASARATVGPALAYGAAGYPPDVPPMSFVVYDIDLVAAEACAAGAAKPPRGPSALLARAGGPLAAAGRGDALTFVGRSARFALNSIAESA